MGRPLPHDVSQQKQKEAKELRQKGWTLHEIAIELGVTDTAVYYWTKEMKRGKQPR